eukprot:TRINITY_DN33392_c0_g1_i1.p1 TRINITY_DN33392_c0_g1~~TRINITY_DN33392_c0_g1_i1.p1  ORF type:complete len:218 (+),score=71.00 TRINITY_DN33392_c0_g1_i1:93-656(+)
MAAKYAQETMGGSDFTCVQIRFEKMIRRASASGKFVIKTLGNNNAYLGQCVDALVKRIQERQKGGIFVASDLVDGNLGSASAARSWPIASYLGQTRTVFQKKFPKAKVFCGSKEHEAWKDKAAFPGVSKVLQAFPGNCAMAEAAICRAATTRLRFGTGYMGDFVMGNDKIGRSWYKTCVETIESRPG